MGTVLQFRQEDFRFKEDRDIGTGSALLNEQRRQRPERERSAKGERRIELDALYGDWKQSSPIIRAAIRLMADARAQLERAIRDLPDDPISSDDAMNRLLPILTELYCCREIGEGFSMVVNALLNAVSNKSSEQWQSAELVAVKDALSHLAKLPFLGLDAALDILERLEDMGLPIQPSGFKHLSEWEDAQSVR